MKGPSISTTALFPSLQFPISKMQFKVIASILLLFVAQTMACRSLAYIVLCQDKN